MKQSYRNSWPGITAGFILSVCLLSAACAPKAPDHTVRPEPVITFEKPFGPTVPLQELLDACYTRQYSSLDSVFELPDSNHSKLMLITHEKPVLIVEDGVTAFTASDNFLAAGYSDGTIRLWSDYPCPVMALPDKEPVSNLWKDEGSPYLGAAGDDESLVSIIDLRRCARVAHLQAEAAVSKISVSSGGSYLALVDEGGRLWTGSIRKEPEHQATLRFSPLDMVFSPREGLLMLADEAGWLIIWTTPDYSVLEQHLIPGGPFHGASFTGPDLVLHGNNDYSRKVIWNIPESKKVEASYNQGAFELDNGVLYYTMAQKQYIKKIRIGEPAFRVMADPGDALLQIVDLDGKTRVYDAVTGFETRRSFAANQSESVEVPLSGIFTWAGVDYALADPVKVRDEWVLWSRYIPEQGHYLWWYPDKGQKKREFAGRLPVRDNIRYEIPPIWLELD